MLESLITPGPPKGIEPDYPYNEDTMFRIIKEPVTMTLYYAFDGSPMTVHYGSQDAVSSGTLIGTSAGGSISIPANVTEFYLKQVTPDTIIKETQILGNQIKRITWNPRLKTNWLWFNGCSKLESVSEYAPQELVNLTGCFQSCPVFNSYIGDWDISNVLNTGSMFAEARAFNQDISKWNTSNLTGVSMMFFMASSFNQDLSGWDVSKVTSRASFDQYATAWQANYKPIFPN